MNEGNEEEDVEDDVSNDTTPAQPQLPQPSTSQPEPSSSQEPDQSTAIGFTPFTSNDLITLASDHAY